MREVMLRNEEAGNCIYWGYALTREAWSSVMQLLRGLNGSESRMPALCMEEHASTASTNFVPTHLPQLVSLRARYQALGLRVPIVLTTRVREPLSFYLSFYRWRVMGMQLHGNRIQLSPGREVVNPIGSNFLEWAPPNLQSVGLLHGDIELFAGLKQGGFPGVWSAPTGGGPRRRPHPFWVQHHTFEKKHFGALMRALSSFDVVAPLEEFDAALLLTSDLTGLPPLQLDEDIQLTPDAHAVPDGVNLSYGAICPDMAACRAHVHRIAPWDVKLYTRVARQFGTRLRGLQPAFGRRLAAYRRARARGAGVCSHEHAAGRPRCCCARGAECFNVTRTARRWVEPATCVPGAPELQRLVANDMRGMCCT